MSNEEIVEKVKEENLLDSKLDERGAIASLCFYFLDVMTTEGILSGGPYRLTEKGLILGKRLSDLGLKVSVREASGFLSVLSDKFANMGKNEFIGMCNILSEMSHEGIPAFLKKYHEFKEKEGIS